jgi:hypothetical protein
MNRKLICFVIIIAVFLSSLWIYNNRYSRTELIKLLNSEDALDVCIACNYIIDKGDSSFYKYLLEKPYQFHNSFDLRCYGLNGYICKMQALEKLSGIKSSKNLYDYHVQSDTTIAEFYRLKLSNRIIK